MDSGVLGLCSRFEERPDQHGQKPVKKPKPALKKPVQNTTIQKNIITKTEDNKEKVKLIKTNAESQQTEPSTIPTEINTRLVVMYDGVELPQEFTAKNGQIYQLRKMPIIDGPPPDKPPKPEKDNDDDGDYGDVAPAGVLGFNTEMGIRGTQGATDNFYGNTQEDEDIYEAYGDVIASRDSHASEIYEDIPAL